VSRVEATLASPELALVDPALAEELRRHLHLVEDAWVRPRVRVHTPALIGKVALVQDELEDHIVEADPQEAEEPSEPHGDIPVEVEPVRDQLESRPVEAERAAEDSIDLPDYIVQHVALPSTRVQGEASVSHYPVLPAPSSGEEAIAGADAALQQIRERLAEDESPAAERKLRPGFTVAAGATALGALGLFAAEIQLGVAQLGWFQF
jgi:hypothetical protein